MIVHIQFQFTDRQLLLNHQSEEDKRNHEWELRMNETLEAFIAEHQEYGDVIKLPMVDVYAHLPYKVLGFLKW